MDKDLTENQINQANKFVDTLERLIIAVVRNEESHHVEDALHLINVKKELFDILADVE